MHLSIMRNFAIKKKKLYCLTSSPSDRTKYTFSQKKKKEKKKETKKTKYTSLTNQQLYENIQIKTNFMDLN